MFSAIFNKLIINKVHENYLRNIFSNYGREKMILEITAIVGGITIISRQLPKEYKKPIIEGGAQIIKSCCTRSNECIKAVFNAGIAAINTLTVNNSDHFNEDHVSNIENSLSGVTNPENDSLSS